MTDPTCDQTHAKNPGLNWGLTGSPTSVTGMTTTLHTRDADRARDRRPAASAEHDGGPERPRVRRETLVECLDALERIAAS